MEAVIELVLKVNPDAIMVIKSTILLDILTLSASDGVLKSVEYRLRVERACRKVSSSFLGREASHETLLQ